MRTTLLPSQHRVADDGTPASRQVIAVGPNGCWLDLLRFAGRRPLQKGDLWDCVCNVGADEETIGFMEGAYYESFYTGNSKGVGSSKTKADRLTPYLDDRLT